MQFPPDFLWGTATAAYHVEGNITNSDWWQWEQTPGAILNGGKSGIACNWWENAEADLDMAAEMGTNAHRLSVDWSRIEPSPGKFDPDALARYRDILRYMHKLGIEPMVTLHHFTNPIWLVEMGDFSNDAVVALFQRFTQKVVAELGDLIPKWCTINEPMVYIALRYLEEAFPPPHKRGWGAGMVALRNLLRCHGAAYHTIKHAFPEALVGVAKQFRPIKAPVGGIPAQHLANKVSDMFNLLWMDAITTGQLRLPAGLGKITHLAGTYDYVGVNYYTYSNIAWPPTARLYDDTYPDDAVVGDGNYGEVYPQGLAEALAMAQQYGKPIYITENGMPDDGDVFRPNFILSHLRETWLAIQRGVPIKGYYHWSLIDNFEWERGWTQRFGLIALDLKTQQRTLRNSGKLYTEICKQGGISNKMGAEYNP